MSQRYALPQRLLHWLIAVLVILALGLGLVIDSYEGFGGLKDTFGLAATNLIYKYHKTLGVLVLGFMLLRMCYRLAYGQPAYDPPLPAAMALASKASHGLLYFCLFAMPVTGWLATAAGGFPVEFFYTKLPGLIGKDKALSETLYEVHGVLGTAILALVALHVSAALYHWLIRRDGVMRRMGF